MLTRLPVLLHMRKSACAGVRLDAVANEAAKHSRLVREIVRNRAPALFMCRHFLCEMRGVNFFTRRRGAASNFLGRAVIAAARYKFLAESRDRPRPAGASPARRAAPSRNKPPRLIQGKSPAKRRPRAGARVRPPKVPGRRHG